MNISYFSLEPFSKFTFHFSLEYMWSLIKSSKRFTHLLTLLNKHINTDTIQISRDNTFELQSQFRCSYKRIVKLYFTVEKMIETDYFCMIKWRVTSSSNTNKLDSQAITTIPEDDTSPDDNVMTIQVSLHYQSENHMRMICQIEGRYPVNITSSNTMKLYKNIERCLSTKNMSNINSESKIITASLLTAISYFENIKICTGLIGKMISATDKEVRKGSRVVTLMNSWDSGKEEELIMQVQKCLTNKSIFKVRFLIYKMNRSTPIRSMETELFWINKNETLAVLTHHFYYDISQDEYDRYSIGKRKFLKKLGNIIHSLIKKTVE